MSNMVEKYRNIWGSNPLSLLEKFDYHPKLTKRLDSLKPEDFNRESLYEIVLWKVSRFPYIEDDLLNELRSVANIKPKEHRKAKELLSRLLRSPGIALPMASTILRFLNPHTFQIIDDRVYRVLLPGKAKYPTKPVKISDGYITNSVSIYFDYLDELHRISSAALPFECTDRILYQLDIILGNRIGEKLTD